MSSIDLTGDEKFILKHLDKTLKYIARNMDGNLYLFCNKPIKCNDHWSSRLCRNFSSINNFFRFIKWADDEPYLIDDLLQQEENK